MLDLTGEGAAAGAASGDFQQQIGCQEQPEFIYKPTGANLINVYKVKSTALLPVFLAHSSHTLNIRYTCNCSSTHSPTYKIIQSFSHTLSLSLSLAPILRVLSLFLSGSGDGKSPAMLRKIYANDLKKRENFLWRFSTFLQFSFCSWQRDKIFCHRFYALHEHEPEHRNRKNSH